MTAMRSSVPPKPSVIRFDDDFVILELVLRNYLSGDDVQQIRKAYDFAERAHQGQTRSSGEPYITHPLAVAEILAQYQVERETVMAGLLHDVLEDCEGIEYEELEKTFGVRVASLVQGVTKVSEIGSVNRSEKDIENFRRMLVATAKNAQVIVIKLADRLHNMRTLHFMPRHKQVSIARQTLDIYAPLAHRMGLGQYKWELEDLCLLFLHPDAYDNIKRNVSLKREEREQFLQQLQKQLEERLAEKHIVAAVEGRAKHFFSIYQKMVRQNRTFDDIYDLIALRVICETVGDCYAILGEVHTLWNQVDGRFKDYISTPKSNNYRSIHTTVLGPFGRWIEIQIRTHEMHAIAEQGVAAHWRYKERDSDVTGSKDLKWTEVFDQELPDTQNPDDFMQSMRNSFFSDEVFVYTPKGDLIRLPDSATPIDFAYRIHTELGHRVGGAKVNGRIVSLNYALKSGDVVEVITSKSSHPTPAWVDIVKTSSARNKIRRYLLESKREELMQIGETNLTRELKKAGFNPLEFYNSNEAKEIVESLSVKDLEDLFINIGFGRISTKQVIARLIQPRQKHPGPQEKGARKPELTRHSLIKLGEIDNILYRLAQCCSPLPGDDISGFVTRGRGVTIHKSTCRNVTHYSGDPERLINLFWEDDHQKSITVLIEIHARDRRNLLGDLSQMISSTGTNILGCESDTVENNAVVRFKVGVVNTHHLNTIMSQLLGIEGVKNVKRSRNTEPRKSSRRNGASD